MAYHSSSGVAKSCHNYNICTYQSVLSRRSALPLSVLKARYCLACALLTAAYPSCWRSISACIVTSHHRQRVQVTAVWLHGCSFELNILSKSSPGLLRAWFRRSDDEYVNIGMDVEDLSDGLWIGTIVFDLHAEDRVVSTPKTPSFANKSWLEGCLHNPSDESLDHYPRFILQLRSAKSSCFKVGTRDLVFRRVWLARIPSA